MKRCAIFGPRICKLTNDEMKNLELFIEKLIIKIGVTVFLFGTNSEFTDICYDIISKKQERFKSIIRVLYPCRENEGIKKCEKEQYQKLYSRLFKKDITVQDYDEIIDMRHIFNAGKSVYYQRNVKMVDECDCSLFYYQNDYKPPKRKYSKNSIFYQPKSGTKLILDYAVKKKKKIFIINEINMLK